MRRALAGRRIWLTRPARQAEPWARALEAAGATVWRQPLLAIEAPADPAAARRGLAAAAGADIVVATSANAVRGAWALAPDFAPAGALYAVGAATAAALAAASGRAVARPAGGDTSERLLALPDLVRPCGQRVTVLAGEGGRTQLVDTLAGRGARVDKIALYRRRAADIARPRLAALLGHADASVVTSAAALAHLVALARAGGQTAPERAALVVPSRRVVEQCAYRLIWTRQPVVVERVSAEAVVAALARLWASDGQ